MAEEITNEVDNTDVSGNTNDNSNSTGADTNSEQKLDDTSKNEGTEPKFTQKDVDNFVKTRLIEEKKRFSKEKDTAIQTAVEKALNDYKSAEQQRIDEAVQLAITERENAAMKAQFKSTLGLTDAQMARLQGDTLEELTADYELVFGSITGKKPPVLHSGGKPKNDNGLDEIEREMLRSLEALNQKKHIK